MAEIGDIGGSGLGGAGRWGVYQEWGRTGLEVCIGLCLKKLDQHRGMLGIKYLPPFSTFSKLYLKDTLIGRHAITNGDLVQLNSFHTVSLIFYHCDELCRYKAFRVCESCD